MTCVIVFFKDRKKHHSDPIIRTMLKLSTKKSVILLENKPGTWSVNVL